MEDFPMQNRDFSVTSCRTWPHKGPSSAESFLGLGLAPRDAGFRTCTWWDRPGTCGETIWKLGSKCWNSSKTMLKPSSLPIPKTWRASTLQSFFCQSWTGRASPVNIWKSKWIWCGDPHFGAHPFASYLAIWLFTKLPGFWSKPSNV